MHSFFLCFRRGKDDSDPRCVKGYKPYLETLNTEGIVFPTPLHQIKKFEEQNNGFTINIYITESDGTSIRPLRISKKDQSDPINLLMIVDRESGWYIYYYFYSMISFYILGQFHYTWISSLDRLLNQHGVKQRTYCPRCLYGFTVANNGEENKRKHLEYCSETDAVKIAYPREGIYIYIYVYICINNLMI